MRLYLLIVAIPVTLLVAIDLGTYLMSIASVHHAPSHTFHSHHHHHHHDNNEDHDNDHGHRHLSELTEDEVAFAENYDFLPCATPKAKESDRIARDKAISFRGLQFRKMFSRDDAESSVTTEKVVRMCFHIPWGLFQSLLGGHRVTNQQLQASLDHLNMAYSAQSCCDPALDWCDKGSCSTNANIRFVMAKRNRLTGQLVENGVVTDVSDGDACVTRPYNPFWTVITPGSRHEQSMKQKLRRGDATVLNLYLTSPQVGFFGGQVLGYSTFPWNYAFNPQYDGVVVNPATMTGGSHKDKTEGDVLVHEIG